MATLLMLLLENDELLNWRTTNWKEAQVKAHLIKSLHENEVIYSLTVRLGLCKELLED